MRGRSVVLVSSGGTHRRLTLRRQSNEFYGVTSEALVDSRATLMTIELHRADTNRE